MNLAEKRQISIEMQSARNAIYNALGDTVTRISEEELKDRIFFTWRVTKQLEAKAEAFIDSEGELEEIELIRRQLDVREKQIRRVR